MGVEETAATFLTLLKPDAPGARPKLKIGGDVPHSSDFGMGLSASSESLKVFDEGAGMQTLIAYPAADPAESS